MDRAGGADKSGDIQGRAPTEGMLQERQNSMPEYEGTRGHCSGRSLKQRGRSFGEEKIHGGKWQTIPLGNTGGGGRDGGQATIVEGGPMYGREGRKEPQECDEVIISRQPGENRKGGPVTQPWDSWRGRRLG